MCYAFRFYGEHFKNKQQQTDGKQNRQQRYYAVCEGAEKQPAALPALRRCRRSD